MIGDSTPTSLDIAALLANPELRRQEFPITAHKVFLAHAAASPLPHRVSRAITEYVEMASSCGQWEYLHADMEKETRRFAARLLAADEDEIAFVSSTSMGLSLVACGLDWEMGDNLVAADGDFPSNIYPWLNLARYGVETKLVPRRRYGAVTLDDIRNAVDEKTRLVSLSSVNFITGFRTDIPAIGEYLNRRGILFCIDAVQSLGAIPIDTRYVDFLASSSHKWLLGPLGMGILYVKRQNIDRLRPALAGWKSVQLNKRYLTYDLCYKESAQRFEPGSPNVSGMVGLHAALKLLLEVGVENIARRLAGLRDTIFSTLTTRGYELVSPPQPENSSGIVSFTSDRIDIAKLRNELDSSGIIVSLRDGLDGRKCIRVSPHFYNTDEEVASFLDSLPTL